MTINHISEIPTKENKNTFGIKPKITIDRNFIKLIQEYLYCKYKNNLSDETIENILCFLINNGYCLIESLLNFD